jgi:ADP-dependent NAD(P)H-hydrate dehydratase / NAD(P)H-hydrate epimerase
MKILCAADIQKLDRYTIENEPIASIDLMERAALACSDWIMANFSSEHIFHIVCGTGNNGGDGFAIARILIQKGYSVNVSWICFSNSVSEDCQITIERLSAIGVRINRIDEFNHQKLQINGSVIIDAIFGTGLNKPVSGLAKQIIEEINASSAKVISIDVPSGLMCEDNTNNHLDGIVKANITLTFQQPKLAFLLPDSGRYVGEFHVLDIGLDKSFIASTITNYHYLTIDKVKNYLPSRSKFSHKGTFGHALLCGGSYGKMGAVVLAGKSALRSGVGLLTLYIPECGYSIMQSTVPEAMVITDKCKTHLSSAWENCAMFSAIGLGPGMGTNKETINFIKDLLHSCNKPMVIDADAINSIGIHPELLKEVPKQSIFTPHLKEFKRLLQLEDELSSFELIQLQRNWSITNQQIVILKGAHTTISLSNGEVWFNSTGNPGMATGGSGDVLTGILTSLLAQGLDAVQTALLGVYVHGKAGDFAAEEIGDISMIAGDIVANLSRAFGGIKKAS